MRTIAVKAHGLLLDFWEVVKIVTQTSYHYFRGIIGTNEMAVMGVVTFGLAFVGGITQNIVLISLMTLSSYRWGQLTMQDDARIICDECQRELEVQ